MNTVRIITLLLLMFAIVNCGSSELGKKAAGELCTCLGSFNPDSEDLDELRKGQACLLSFSENKAYNKLRLSDVKGSMAEQCPAEKAKLEKLTAEQ